MVHEKAGEQIEVRGARMRAFFCVCTTWLGALFICCRFYVLEPRNGAEDPTAGFSLVTAGLRVSHEKAGEQIEAREA